MLEFITLLTAIVTLIVTLIVFIIQSNTTRKINQGNILSTIYVKFNDSDINTLIDFLEKPDTKLDNIFQRVSPATEGYYKSVQDGLNKILSLFDELQYFHKNKLITSQEMMYNKYEVMLLIKKDKYVSGYISEYHEHILSLQIDINEEDLPFTGYKYLKGNVFN